MFEYFFRTIPDPGTKLTGILQILLLLGLICVFFLAYKFKDNDKALRIGLICSFLHQLSIYSWYVIGRYHLLDNGLPLYHCRIAMMGLVICYFLKNDKMLRYFAILGFVGGMVALLVPDIDPFKFPHITNFSFVLGHYFLMFNAGIVLFKKINLNFKEILLISLLMNAFILCVDLTVNANYAFLLKLPKALAFIPIKGLSVSLLVTLVLIGVMYIVNMITFHKEFKN